MHGRDPKERRSPRILRVGLPQELHAPVEECFLELFRVFPRVLKKPPTLQTSPGPIRAGHGSDSRRLRLRRGPDAGVAPARWVRESPPGGKRTVLVDTYTDAELEKLEHVFARFVQRV